jgi:hypothetical protein
MNTNRDIVAVVLEMAEDLAKWKDPNTKMVGSPQTPSPAWFDGLYYWHLDGHRRLVWSNFRVFKRFLLHEGFSDRDPRGEKWERNDPRLWKTRLCYVESHNRVPKNFHDALNFVRLKKFDHLFR